MVRAMKVRWLPRQTLCGGKIKRKMAKSNQFQALTMVTSHKGDHPITNCSGTINKHPMDSKEARVKLEENHGPSHATRKPPFNFPVGKITKLLHF